VRETRARREDAHESMMIHSFIHSFIRGDGNDGSVAPIRARDATRDDAREY